MKVVAIIQARLGSTRLPRKVLAEIEGRPLIDHVVERALAIEGVDTVVLNTPKADGWEIINACQNRGQENVGIENQEQDVRGSFYEIARYFKADVIMRLTGDCPLLAPDLSADVLRYFLKHQPDYCANINPPTTWADGWDTEVFTCRALQRSVGNGDISPYAKQHVTTMLKQLGACLYYPAPHDWTKTKLSVDTEEDLTHVRAVFKELKKVNGGLGWRDTDTAIKEVCSYVRRY